MRISEAKDCIKSLYEHTSSVTALISERGIGKTSAYQQCAKELGIGYIDLYAAALEGPDFMGLPDKDQERGITRYLAPQFLPTVQAVEAGIYPQKGIIVLEEINRVPSDTASVLYPLLLDKRINGHDLAGGWAIGVTMNPDTMNYLVNSLDDAMLDRFIAIEVSANLDDFIDYSLQNHPNDDVIAFLQAFPDMLLMVKSSAESTALTKSPTPRGWTKVQEILNNCNLELRLMKELIAGIVGPHAASTFYGYLNNRQVAVPSSAKLLNDYSTVKDAIINLVDENRLDILNYVIKKTALDIEQNRLHIENVNGFMADLPEELQILFFKHVSAKQEDKMDWIIEGVDIFDDISDRIVDVINIV